MNDPVLVEGFLCYEQLAHELILDPDFEMTYKFQSQDLAKKIDFVVADSDFSNMLRYVSDGAFTTIRRFLQTIKFAMEDCAPGISAQLDYEHETFEQSRYRPICERLGNLILSLVPVPCSPGLRHVGDRWRNVLASVKVWNLKLLSVFWE